jgi:hypothetical protein
LAAAPAAVNSSPLDTFSAAHIQQSGHPELLLCFFYHTCIKLAHITMASDLLTCTTLAQAYEHGCATALDSCRTARCACGIPTRVLTSRFTKATVTKSEMCQSARTTARWHQQGETGSYSCGMLPLAVSSGSSGGMMQGSMR